MLILQYMAFSIHRTICQLTFVKARTNNGTFYDPRCNVNEGPLWAAGHQTDETGRSLDPAVALNKDPGMHCK